MKYLKLILVTLTLSLMFGGATVSAASPGLTLPLRPTILADSFDADACNGLTSLSKTTTCNSNKNTFDVVAKLVVNLLSIVVGIISVIMIIVAALKFITSGGDANSAKSARSTLIYALAGLAIAVLAQLMAHFVLNTANSIKNSGYLDSHSSISRDA